MFYALDDERGEVLEEVEVMAFEDEVVFESATDGLLEVNKEGVGRLSTFETLVSADDESLEERVL